MTGKRIIIVTDAAPPQINGVVRTLWQLKHELKKRGCKVFMITPQMFMTFPCPTYPEIRLSLVRKKHFRKIIEKVKPDHIHICTEGPLGFCAKRFCDSRKIRYTTSYHTKFPEYIRERFFIPLSVTYSYLRRFHEKSAGILVPTKSICDELEPRGFKNLVTWTRGVDRSIFHTGYKDQLFAGLERPIYINVGRVAIEKNIDAFMKLNIKGTKVLVGDGPYMQTLRKNYPGTVFAGYRRGKELAAHYANADVFVFPSRTDTFGLVLIEAMACGIPTVAFNVPGPKDLIKHGINGFLVEDSNEMEKACLEALKLDRKHIAESVSEYTWENCAEIFLNNLTGSNI